DVVRVTFSLYAEVIGNNNRLTNLYRVSLNAGTAGAPTWTAVANRQNPFRGGQGNIHGAILADPNDPHRVYLSRDPFQIYPFTGILYQVDAAAGTWTLLSLGKDNVTTLSNNDIDANVTTLRVADSSRIPNDALIRIDNELMRVRGVNRANHLVAVTRGVNGTAAAAHGGTSRVILVTNGANNTGPHADSRDLEWHNGSIVWAGDGGLYELTQLTTSPRWTSVMGDLQSAVKVSTLQTTQFIDVALDTVHNSIIGGSQDNSTEFLVGGRDNTGTESLKWQGSHQSGDGVLVAVDKSAT